MLDYLLTFLFINAKSKARIAAYSNSYIKPINERSLDEVPNLSDSDNLISLHNIVKARAIYEKQIKSYLFGLGFLLSFVPDTEAFLARKELFTLLMKNKDSSIWEFLKMPFSTADRSNKAFAAYLQESALYFGSGANFHPLNIFYYPCTFLVDLPQKFIKFIDAHPSNILLKMLGSILSLIYIGVVTG